MRIFYDEGKDEYIILCLNKENILKDEVLVMNNAENKLTAIEDKLFLEKNEKRRVAYVIKNNNTNYYFLFFFQFLI